jgi:hypothetical protein
MQFLATRRRIMPLYGNSKLHEEEVERIEGAHARQDVLNFKRNDEELFKELEQLTSLGAGSLQKGGVRVLTQSSGECDWTKITLDAPRNYPILGS